MSDQSDHRRAVLPIERLLGNALLVHASVDAAKQLATPGVLPDAVTGIVVGGADSAATVRRLRGWRPDLILMSEPEDPHRAAATVDHPFFLDTDGMFPETLADALDGQIRNGCSVAITPTRYIQSADSASLKRVLSEVNALDRQDTLAWFPVDSTWLSNPTDRRQLIAALRRAEHPVAVSFGHDQNPLKPAGAANGLVELCSQIPGLVVLRTDHFGVAESIARSNGASSFGFLPSQRRLTPPSDKGFSSKPGVQHFPHVGILDWMAIKHSTTLRELYVNADPPRCSIADCDGRRLDGYGSSDEERHAAHLHNVHWAAEIYGRLACHSDLSHRAAEIHGMYQRAISAHADAESELERKLPPPSELTALAEAAALLLRSQATR